MEMMHRELARLNHRRLEPTVPGVDDEAELANERTASELELKLLRAERRAIATLAARAPTDADAFVVWFEALKQTGPGQHDRLFPWLAEEATHAELCWFLFQEVAGEAGFDDLVALAQVKMPARAKLEMARNYWDEMGQGTLKGMHGGMLADLCDELALHPRADQVVWETVAVGNLMLAMAKHRSWAYHAVGALGAIELTAPTRVSFVHDGLARLGISPRGRKYFAVHATLDVKHSEAWDREVLHTLVADRPEVAVALAEGALIRMSAGARCFVRYRRELALGSRDGALRGWRPPE